MPCTLNSCSGSLQTFSGENPARLPSSWNSAIEYLQEISVWIVSPGANHADDEELTRTQKVRRTTIVTKYRGMIESLFSGPTSEESLAGAR